VKARIMTGTAAESVDAAESEVAVLTSGEEATLRMLKPDTPRHIDEIISSCRLSYADLMSALLGLEMKDRIKELPGKMFVRKL
jgi:predicted Rossmann fold nucleotide-binding protein DprA/Smf involved in DNA uptake